MVFGQRMEDGLAHAAGRGRPRHVAQGRDDDDAKIKDIAAMGSLNHLDFGRSARDQIRGKGAAVYRLVWNMDHERAFRRWSGQRSAGRRWLPLDGREWRLVKAATNYTPAYHVMRLMAGGLAGGASQRSTAGREARPRTCLRCGSLDVAWAWTTASKARAGKAWCRGCIPDVAWTEGVPGGHSRAGKGMRKGACCPARWAATTNV